jgi:hypothetical protein
MPGKYPTIVANTTARTTITPGPAPDGVGSGYSLSNSDTNALRSLFPGSPIYPGTDASVSAEQLRMLAQRLLLDGTVEGGNGYSEGVAVSRDFVGAPDLNEVQTGGGGLPASPFFPNLASAADPADPSTQPEMDPAVVSGITPNDNWGSGVGIVNPSESSTVLSQTSVVETGPVANKGQSAAHALNPGASSV